MFTNSLPSRGTTPTTIFLVFAMLAATTLSYATLVVRPASAAIATATPTSEAVVDEMVGAGLTVSNVRVHGAEVQTGTFDDPAGVLGLTGGTILSSGTIDSITGPNDDNNASTDIPDDTDPPGLAGLLDEVLDLLTPHDVAAIQFDFVPDSNRVYANYVMASEEYGFIVPLNGDGVGIFINGVNCATVPLLVLATPVTPLLVNGVVNASYYNSNVTGSYDTQADGFTDVLQCSAPVRAGEVNTATIIVADAGTALLDDEDGDTWLLVGEGSFSTKCSGAFCPIADLSVSASVPTIAPGATGEVDFTLTNAGPDDAAATRLIFSPPADVSFGTVPAECAADTPETGTITCDVGTISASGPVLFSVPVVVDDEAAPLSSLAGGSAALTALGTVDPDGAEVSVSISTGEASADVSVVVDTPTAAPGTNAEVVIDVTNNGPSATATTTEVVYNPPSGLIIDLSALNSGCSAAIAAGPATCTVGLLGNGEMASVTIPVFVPADAGTGTIFAGGLATVSNDLDASTGNDTATSSIEVGLPESSFTIEVSDPGDVVPGTGATLTIDVTNDGPSDSAETALTFDLPDDVTIDPLELSPCTAPSVVGPVTCDLGALTDGAETSVRIPVMVSPSAPASSTLANGEVTVGNGGGDSSVATTLDTAAASANLRVIVTDPPPIVPGGSGDAVISVTNDGPSATTSVTTVVYTQPAGMTVDNGDLPGGCTAPGANGPVTCLIPTLAFDETVDLDIPLVMPGTAEAGEAFVGGSAAVSNPDDRDSSNDSAESAAEASSGIADLEITIDPPTDVVPGTRFDVKVTVDNHGPSAAADAIVFYTPEEGFEIDLEALVGLPCTAESAHGPVSCDLGDIASGADVSIDIPVIALGSNPPETLAAGGSISVTSDAVDPDQENSIDVEFGVAIGLATTDLSLVVTDPGPVPPGGSADVVIEIANDGPSDAAVTTVLYTPPIGAIIDLSELPLNCSAELAAGPATCFVDDIESGSSDTVTIAVLVSSTAVPDTVLFGGVTTALAGLDLDGALILTGITVGPREADLALVVDAAPTLQPGESGVVDLSLVSNGPSDSTSVVITYTLPAGVEFDPTGTNPLDCAEAAGVITCAMPGPVSAGANVDVLIPVKVSADLPAAGPLAPGVVEVDGGIVFDPTLSNNSVEVTVELDLTGDADGDGISDAVEIDPDNDGTPDDTDRDGTPDYRDTDSDNDGIADAVEHNPDGSGNPADSDGDNVPDYRDSDSDNDGMPDSVEADRNIDGTIDDTDGDTVPDYLDLDSDNDGLLDAAEGDIDTDTDGFVDAVDLDSDADGIPDVVEGGNGALDADRDGELDDVISNDADHDGLHDQASTTTVDSDSNEIPDASSTDSDSDGLPDSSEVGPDVYDPLDTDSDGLPDYRDADSDQDGIDDRTEAGPDPSNPADANNDGVPNHLDDDSDGDLIPDAVEAGPDPTSPVDSDQDGIPDYLDLDSDNDGKSDAVEAGPVPSNPIDADGNGQPDYIDADSDGDGVPDAIECRGGCVDTDQDGSPDHRDADSDGDGILDSIEVGDDVTNPRDTDQDGIPDMRDLDSDGDGFSDRDESTPNLNADADRDGIPDYIDPAASIDLSVDAPEVSFETGGMVSFDLRVDNQGLERAHDTAISFELPVGVEFVGAEMSKSNFAAAGKQAVPCTEAVRRLTCLMGDMEPSSFATMGFQVATTDEASGLAIEGFSVSANGRDIDATNNIGGKIMFEDFDGSGKIANNGQSNGLTNNVPRSLAYTGSNVLRFVWVAVALLGLGSLLLGLVRRPEDDRLADDEIL